MIAFKDFVPQQIRKQGFIKPPQWETVEQAVAAANEWIREQEVAVINVETVVLPNLDSEGARSGDGNPRGDGSVPFSDAGGWSQVVRVWYRVD